MTTQSDLLKQAYELIRKTVGRKCTLCEIPSSYNQVYEPNITLIDGVPFHKHRGPSPDGAEWKCTAPGEAIWLRDYEAAEHCDGHNLGSGTVKYENCPICHAKYGAAPSPATEQVPSKLQARFEALSERGLQMQKERHAAMQSEKQEPGK